MAKKKGQRVWMFVPQAPKFTAEEKAALIERIKSILKSMTKLSQKVSRIDMKANRVYLYELVEQFVPEGAVLIKPLIEGKYLEYPYARITLQDTQGNNCIIDYQRHNNQWMPLYNGTLIECLGHIEEDDAWF